MATLKKRRSKWYARIRIWANDIRKERNALAGEEKSKQENTASFNEMSASIREAIVQRNELQEQRKFTWRDMELMLS